MPAKSSTKPAVTAAPAKPAKAAAKSTPKTKAASPVVKGAVVKTAAKKAAPAKAKTAKAAPVVPDLPVGSIVTDAAGWWATISKVNAKSYVLDYGTETATVSKAGVVLLDSIVPTAKATIKADKDGGFTVWTKWEGRHFDDASDIGIAVKDKAMADRLAKAINDQKVFEFEGVGTRDDGSTYVLSSRNVMGRRANADLKRIGY